MYNLKAFITKLFSQLRIPSEREIRLIQLRQMRRALSQTYSYEEHTMNTTLNCDQELRQSNTPSSNKSEMKNFNAIEVIS